MTGFFGSLELMRKMSSKKQNKKKEIKASVARTLSAVRAYWAGSRPLTQLVEVSVDPIGSRHGAHQPRLQEGGPLVHQTPVAPKVIL